MSKVYKVYVVPHNGEWAVKLNSNPHPISIHQTRDEAIEATKVISQPPSVELIIKSPSGHVQESRSGGKEVHLPKRTNRRRRSSRSGGRQIDLLNPSGRRVTVIKMLESLPIEAQDRVVEHLREYIEELQDEIRWDNSFKRTRSKLAEVATQAEQEIAEGKAIDMDYDRL